MHQGFSVGMNHEAFSRRRCIMANQSGSGRHSPDQQQRQGRQDDSQQQDQRSAGGNQGGQAGKQAGSGRSEGEKIGQWTEDDEDDGMGASGPAESGGGGFDAPGGSNKSSK
jgi:hypothetical protein